jgi:hypothetical protein
LDAAKPSYSNAKGQNETQSINGVYNTAIKPPNIKQQMSQALHYIKQPSVPKTLTTDKYDATAKLVNEEIAALGDDGTFADLKLIDKKLGLPRGSSFEMGGFSDYFAFVETDDD